VSIAQAAAHAFADMSMGSQNWGHADITEGRVAQAIRTWILNGTESLRAPIIANDEKEIEDATKMLRFLLGSLKKVCESTTDGAAWARSYAAGIVDFSCVAVEILASLPQHLNVLRLQDFVHKVLDIYIKAPPMSAALLMIQRICSPWVGQTFNRSDPREKWSAGTTMDHSQEPSVKEKSAVTAATRLKLLATCIVGYHGPNAENVDTSRSNCGLAILFSDDVGLLEEMVRLLIAGIKCCYARLLDPTFANEHED